MGAVGSFRATLGHEVRLLFFRQIHGHVSALDARSPEQTWHEMGTCRLRCWAGHKPEDAFNS